MTNIVKAYIQWTVEDEEGNEIASSYEHISDASDAQRWADKMQEYEEGEE